MLDLSLLTPKCSLSTIPGDRTFSLIWIIFIIREECVSLRVRFWNKMLTRTSQTCPQNHSGSGTRPVQSPVTSEGSVMCGRHGNVVVHIPHSARSVFASWHLRVLWQRGMGNLNCCLGGRFPLILWRLFLQMGWFTFTDEFSSSFFFFFFHRSNLSTEL